MYSIVCTVEKTVDNLTYCTTTDHKMISFPKLFWHAIFVLYYFKNILPV